VYSLDLEGIDNTMNDGDLDLLPQRITHGYANVEHSQIWRSGTNNNATKSSQLLFSSNAYHLDLLNLAAATGCE
jgi:hypothetical protein